MLLYKTSWGGDPKPLWDVSNVTKREAELVLLKKFYACGQINNLAVRRECMEIFEDEVLLLDNT